MHGPEDNTVTKLYIHNYICFNNSYYLVGWVGGATLSLLTFPRYNDPIFPRENPTQDNKRYQKTKTHYFQPVVVSLFMKISKMPEND